MNPAVENVLELHAVSCRRGPVAVRVLSLAVAPATFTLLLGTAGSGHDLLLRLLGLLETPDFGAVSVAGAPTHGLREQERVRLRDRQLGFVFAAPFLLPAFTVIENVAMPLFKISEVDPTEARARSEVLLEFAGLLELAQVSCALLAPLEQQCVALARALANEPAALLVENLDATLSGEELRAFAALLRQSAGRFGVAVIATASPAFTQEPADRVIEITEGVVSRDSALFPVSGA